LWVAADRGWLRVWQRDTTKPELSARHLAALFRDWLWGGREKLDGEEKTQNCRGQGVRLDMAGSRLWYLQFALLCHTIVFRVLPSSMEDVKGVV